MTTALPYCGHRFGGRPEPVERDIPTSPFTPNTLVEYRDLVTMFGKLQRWVMHLHAMKSAYQDMPARYRDELNGFDGVQPLELDKAIKRAETLRDKMETGLDEWNRGS